MQNKINKIINSKVLTCLLELVLPTVLSILLTMYNDQKYYNKDCDINDGISLTFSFLFFFIVLMEWLRRYKVKESKFAFEKYIYIGVLLLIFLLGIWYANSICQ